MAKKAKSTGAPRRTSPAGSARGIAVRDSAGNLHPFLRGMVTHDLVQRGLSFDDAYAAARSIRNRLGKRDEVPTAQLKEVIDEQLLAMFGAERLTQLSPSGWPTPPEIEVVSNEARQPFSRGLLAHSLSAAGLELDRSYRLVTQLQGELIREGVQSLTNEEVARRAGDLLERAEGTAVAARYRLVRRIRRLPRPLVIYLGGASGTGKSTLALGIAPLLRIYRITATDTIRQVMRMVFAPAILPALHASSFEVAPGVQGVEEGEGSLLSLGTFLEQATRVCVGVRAVVERAILENMSVVVEGVHLLPDLVPFKDLEGSVHQVSLMLTTLSEDTHRGRFLTRARQAPRAAERYIENFGAIRALQGFLSEQAEKHEVPLFDTSDSETAIPRALRLVTGLLEERLPWLGKAEESGGRVLVPALLLVIDGLADHPTRSLAGRTPLEAAHAPTLDRLAKEGRVGLADAVAPGVVPDTAAGSLALLAQPPHAMQRGPVEALGAGFKLRPGDLALRANFATLSPDGKILDRRAGRIRGAGVVRLAQALDRMKLPGKEGQGVEVRVRPTTEHRLAVVFRGENLSASIHGSDPGDGAPPGPPLDPRALDPRDKAAVRTAKLLAAFEHEARRRLERHPVNQRRAKAGEPAANALLTRGIGRVQNLPPLEVGGLPLRLACVGGDRTFLGLATWLGGEALTDPGFTANLDTDLGAKFKLAERALADHDLVVLHVKGADIAAHDQRPDLKVSFLERVDRALGRLLTRHKGPLRVAVAGDHATLSEAGQHGADPIPVLLWGTGIKPDRVKTYGERAAAAGTLGRFPLQLLLDRLFDER